MTAKLSAEAKLIAKTERLNKAIARAKAGSLKSAAYLTRETAIDSIKISKKKRGTFWKINRKGKRVKATYWEPSPVGQPVYAHVRGKFFFRRGIKYDVSTNNDEAHIGYTHSQFQTAMSVHEHALSENGTQYDERPTMRPALERNVERFAKDWRSAIG